MVRQVAGFLLSHQLQIGLSLTLITVADLSFIIANIDATLGSFTGLNVAMPQSNLAIPGLFAICMIGTILLCVYCVRGIGPQKISNKEYAAMLLVALGFTYQVIGAWPLWNKAYPWLWQQEIAKFGNLLVLPLFAASLFSFIVGAASLYLHSKIWRQRNLSIVMTNSKD
jgi:hypothetical protein